MFFVAFMNHRFTKNREDEKNNREREATRVKLLACLSTHIETLSRINDGTEPSTWQEALDVVREYVSKADHVVLVLGEANYSALNALLNQEQRAIEEQKTQRPRRLISEVLAQSSEDKKRRAIEDERYAAFTRENVAVIHAAYHPFVSIAMDADSRARSL